MITRLKWLLLSSTIAIALPVAAHAVSQLPTTETLSEARSVQRDELDLRAQQEMAKWAWWMLLVSGASAGVGIVGIYWVVQTLKTTQRATDAAHEANELMRQEKRPWLSVKVSHAAADLQYRPHPKEQYVTTPMVFEVTNHGNQPAIYCNFEQHTGADGIIRPFDPEKCSIHKGFHDSPLNNVIFPGETRRETPLYQTPFSELRVTRFPSRDDVHPHVGMGGKFYLGVVYMSPDDKTLRRTTVLVHWDTFVPLDIFKENESWLHSFRCNQVFGNSVI